MPHADPEARRAYMREYKRKRRQTEVGKAEHRAEQAAAYVRRGADLRARVRAYRAANPEKCKAWTDAKVARNPEAERQRKNALSQRRRAQTGAVIDKQVFIDTLRCADGVCAYCLRSASKLEVDHVLPLSRGGSCETNNLVAACASCNRRKSNKTALEWVFGFRLQGSA